MRAMRRPDPKRHKHERNWRWWKGRAWLEEYARQMIYHEETTFEVDKMLRRPGDVKSVSGLRIHHSARQAAKRNCLARADRVHGISNATNVGSGSAN